MRIVCLIMLFVCFKAYAPLINPFVTKAHQYTFIFHEHCNILPDDGSFTPTELATAWEAEGIDAYAITPHSFILTDPGVPGITFFVGEECFTTGSDRHVIGLFITNSISSALPQSVINSIRTQGGFCTLAHPWINSGFGWTTNELLQATNYNAIEICTACGWTGSELWDAILLSHRIVWSTAGPDAHNVIRSIPYVCVNADSLSDIPYSLASGNFYITTGNRISVTVTNTTIFATSDSTGKFVWTLDGAYAKTNVSTTTSFITLYNTNIYARFRFFGDDGNFAWSQPVFFNSTSSVNTANVRNLNIR